MQRDICKRPKLLIVSDTAVFESGDGGKEAFEPVVREIESFGCLFESITWIAARHDILNRRKNIRKVQGVDVDYILFNAVGGGGIVGKFRILRTYFILFFVILKEVRKADVIHTRGPSHPAIIAAFISLFFREKVFWQKYAGNWIRKKEALSYRFQKFLMKKSKHSVVTINGKWENQENHILTFENPCLTQEERIEGLKSLKNKDYKGKLDFVFVGRLENAKGVDKIIEVFSGIDNDRIGIINFVGDGPMRENYEKKAKNSVNYNVVFHGMLDKIGVSRVLGESHIALLPSDSEGFPKVVAEAANFGCVNIVSNVSCLSQYIIDGETGFVMDSLDLDGLKEKINICLSEKYDLKMIANKAYQMGSRFTYSYYNERIINDILKVNHV